MDGQFAENLGASRIQFLKSGRGIAPFASRIPGFRWYAGERMSQTSHCHPMHHELLHERPAACGIRTSLLHQLIVPTQNHESVRPSILCQQKPGIVIPWRLTANRAEHRFLDFHFFTSRIPPSEVSAAGDPTGSTSSIGTTLTVFCPRAVRKKT
jgi:hypothetical protein